MKSFTLGVLAAYGYVYADLVYLQRPEYIKLLSASLVVFCFINLFKDNMLLHFKLRKLGKENGN